MTVLVVTSSNLSRTRGERASSPGEARCNYSKWDYLLEVMKAVATVMSQNSTRLTALLSFRDTSNATFQSLPQRVRDLGVEVVMTVTGLGDWDEDFPSDYSRIPNFTIPDVWDRLPVTREAVLEFSRYEHSNDFNALRLTMLSMQNRGDFTGTYRTLEREVQIRRLLVRVFSGLLERRPQFAVFDVTPHDHVSVAIEGALRWLGVPVLSFQPSLVGPQSIPRSSLTKIFDFSISLETREKYGPELAEVVSLAQASIERLEKGAGTVKISAQKQREVSARTPRGRLKSLRFMLSRLAKGLHFPSVNFSGHTVLPPWFTKPLEVILDWSLRRSLVSTILSIPSHIPETGGKFALFALHYEPERCSIPEGYPYSSQIDAVLRARALLPDDVVLVVKEHFSQSAAALRGALGRSPDTYSMLEGIPGVKVLGIKANTPELIARAECVFTLTGKVGIEAALKGTPVVYGGQPWWGRMPGSAALYSFEDSSALEEFCRSPRPSRDDVFSWLSDQFTHTLVPVLGDATVERYSERISPLPQRFADLQLDVVLEVIDSFITAELLTNKKK